MTHISRRDIVLISLIALALWIWTVGLWFQNDDVRLIDLAVEGRWSELLGFFAPIPGIGFSQLYRPVSHALLLGTSVFAKNSSWVYHFVSVLLHITATLLVVGILDRLRGRMVALVSGLLFAIHPIHILSVAWISGQTDLLATVGALAALYLGLKDRWGWASLAFGLAILSKEVGATALGLAVLIGWYQSYSRSESFALKKNLRKLTPQLAIFAGWALLSVYISPLDGRMDSDWSLWSGISGLVRIPGYLILPGWYDKVASFQFGLGLVLGIGIAGITVAGLYSAMTKGRGGEIATGLVWVVIAVSPVIFLDLLTGEPPRRWYLYLPSVGFCWVWAEMAAGYSGTARKIVIGSLCLILGIGYVTQAKAMFRASHLAERSANSLREMVDGGIVKKSRYVLLGLPARRDWMPVLSTNPDAAYRLAGGTRNLAMYGILTLDIFGADTAGVVCQATDSVITAALTDQRVEIFRPEEKDFPTPFGVPMTAIRDGKVRLHGIAIHLRDLPQEMRGAEWLCWNGRHWDRVETDDGTQLN